MTTIAIDIDDTLTSFTGLAREIMGDLAAETGNQALKSAAYAPWDEWRSPPDLIGDSDVSWLDIIEMAHQPECILSNIPFKGAVDTIWELYAEGYKLLYISNRNEDLYQPTYEWLAKNNFPLGPRGDLVCTTQDKTPFMQHCQYLIDDRVKTLGTFVTDYTWKLTYGAENESKRRLAFALRTEYNRGLSDFPNVYLAPNWSLLRHYMVEKGVLSGDTHSANAAFAIAA